MTNQVLPPIWRGLKRRCPHCKDGDLVCTVALITLGTKVRRGLFSLQWIVFLLCLALQPFFGFRISHWIVGVIFFCAVTVSIVVTMPQRQGFAIALNYLSWVYVRDPSDLLPCVNANWRKRDDKIRKS